MDWRDGNGDRRTDRDVATSGAPAADGLCGRAASRRCRARGRGGCRVIGRRAWLQSIVLAGGGSLIARASGAQQRTTIADTSNLFAMDQSAARSVRLAPKPGSAPSMTDDARDALEH